MHGQTDIKFNVEFNDRRFWTPKNRTDALKLVNLACRLADMVTK